MKSTRSRVGIWSGLGTLGVCGVLLAMFSPSPPSPSSGSSSQQWTPFIGIPPLEMFMTDGQQWHTIRDDGANRFRLKVRVRYPKARLSLQWDHKGSNGYLWQDIPLSYVPTAIAIDASNDDFLIAGRTRSGQTLVERMHVGNPPAIGIADPITGKVNTTLYDAPIQSVDRLYEGAMEGLDYITSICFYGPGWTELLLQGWDSQDLYRLSAVPPASGLNTPELLASDTIVGPSVLSCPALERHFGQLTAYNTVNFGYLYHCDTVYIDLSPIIVWDLNRDGLLDDWMEVPDSVTWESLGLHEPSGYLPWQ